jgi:rubrerythrin
MKRIWKTKTKRRRYDMMSNIPTDVKKVDKTDINKEILRVGMIAELDAISLYEQLASMTDDKDIRKVILDIAKEEKTHMGEFQALLLRNDKQQVEELKKGKDEVEEKTG